jgi:S1-C subfamily serine protease
MSEGSGYEPYGGYGYPPPPPPGRRGGGLLSHLIVAALAAGVAIGATLGLYHPASGGSPASGTALPGASAVPSPGPSGPVGDGSTGSSGNTGVQRVVNKVEPGLVIVNTTLQYNNEAGAGTGMVINGNGLVLTNNHVISDSTKITATVVATSKTYPATVVGYSKTRDIALIRLQGASGLRTVPIGNSDAVKVADAVVALGNADGQGSIIPAGGRVTGLGKTITASDQSGTTSTETLHGMIQTNAGIVSGDSGGPLANGAGQVIGMTTAGNSVSLSQQEPASGFAIPLNAALDVAREIAAGHASSTITIGYPPFVGIFIGSGTSGDPRVQARQQAGSNPFGGAAPSCYTNNTGLVAPLDIAPAGSGTLVIGTICGSPAAASGMSGGAVITAVNGKAVGAPNQLSSILAGFRPGQTISVTWENPAGKTTTSSLHLVAGPPQ